MSPQEVIETLERSAQARAAAFGDEDSSVTSCRRMAAAVGELVAERDAARARISSLVLLIKRTAGVLRTAQRDTPEDLEKPARARVLARRIQELQAAAAATGGGK